jgi:hypothetical protein
MQPFYIAVFFTYYKWLPRGNQSYALILILNTYFLVVSTIWATIEFIDKMDDLFDSETIVLGISYLLIEFVSFGILTTMTFACWKESYTGRRQQILHPGEVFDAREYFEDIPTIIYQPFSNIKSKNWAIWLMDYDDQDSIKVLPIWFHTFHTEWIRLWFANNSTCPFCRRVFTRGDIDNWKDMNEDEIYRWIEASSVRPSLFFPNKELKRYQRDSREVPYDPQNPP